VEHPVTEQILDVDLVALQLRVAEGHPLGFDQQDLVPQGWSMEARLYAEDPDGEYLPSVGRVLAYEAPGGGVRMDSGIETGTTVGIHFDPMMAKVVAHGVDRDAARQRLSRAMERLVVLGLRTNRSHLARVLEHPAFVAGKLHTGFLTEYESELGTPVASEWLSEITVAGVVLSRHRRLKQRALPGLSRTYRSNPWPFPPVEMAVTGPGFSAQVALCYREDESGGLRISSHRWTEDSVLPGFTRQLPPDAEPILVEGASVRWDIEAEGRIWLEIDGLGRHYDVAWESEDVLWIHHPQGEARVEFLPDFPVSDPTGAAGNGTCRAPMPGRVVRVEVQPGDAVAAGDPLLVLEAMKMEQTLSAAIAGTVTVVTVSAGDQVELGQGLVTVEPPAEGD
jgi:acetyl/propionyl-CoA carboxylase alpha subunit